MLEASYTYNPDGDPTAAERIAFTFKGVTVTLEGTTDGVLMMLEELMTADGEYARNFCELMMSRTAEGVTGRDHLLAIAEQATARIKAKEAA